MSANLELAAIAYNEPRLIAEQIRLLQTHLKDDFAYTVVDNSSDEDAAAAIESICKSRAIGYRRCWHEKHEHATALAFAWGMLEQETDARYLGVLDHDVFPTCSTKLVPLIESAGFYGIGQRHAPTGHQYLWPGFCFFSRAWLADRPVDFGGIRGEIKADDGDTGSAMWPLFVDEDWRSLYRVDHGYRPVREPDSFGLQSWGYETIGDFVHFSNGSHWMRVPDPDGRDTLLFDLLAQL